MTVCACMPDGSLVVVAAPPSCVPAQGTQGAGPVAFWMMEGLLKNIEEPDDKPYAMMGLFTNSPVMPTELAEFEAQTGKNFFQHPAVCGMMVPTRDVWEGMAHPE